MSGLGSSPIQGTSEINQVLNADMLGDFSRGIPVHLFIDQLISEIIIKGT